MDINQESAFWETIKILDETDVLSYVMVIGSWAEYIYSYYFESNYQPNIRTRDVDFLYPNIRKPNQPIKLEAKMKDAGYVVERDYYTQVVKMFKEDLLEIEFLTQAVAAGKESYLDIPAIGIRGQSLRDVNLLARFPLLIEVKKFNIIVPEPAVYALQKIIINPHRKPSSKREKDIDSVRIILPHIYKSARDLKIFKEILHDCTKKERKTITQVCNENKIDIIE
jgi:hypothetical protein